MLRKKKELDNMASTRGHSIRGKEHDIAFSLALNCAITLRCIRQHVFSLALSFHAVLLTKLHKKRDCMLIGWGWMVWRAREDTVCKELSMT